MRVKKWVATQINSSDDIAILKQQSKALANGTIEASDMIDPSEEENGKSQVIIRWSESDWYKVYKALEFYEKLLGQLSPIKQGVADGMAPEIGLLNSLSNLLSLVEEMSTLGRQGGINQGLKTNMKDFYDFKYKVEDLVNDELSLKSKKDTFKDFLGTLSNVNTFFNEELLKLSEEPFSMTRFL